jgi:hypothetical protein
MPERYVTLAGGAASSIFLHMRHSANVNNHRRTPHYSPGRIYCDIMHAPRRENYDFGATRKVAERGISDKRRKYLVQN